MKYFLPFLILSILSPLLTLSQNVIKGHIKNQENKPLPYATIYIQELHTGTVSNEDGYYEYKLQPGTYHLKFQFLGYKSENKTINIGNDEQILNIRLLNQSIDLKEVNIVATTEDPAYSIMRKVVAKSNFHLMQLESYKAKVYIKGFFKVDVPKIIYKLAKSEGLDTVEVHTSETYSELEYEYPNTYRQKVISARSNESDSNGVDINQYINSSFYTFFTKPVFSLYRFRLEGSFVDQGFEIYKIKIFPRSKGPGLYTGYIYIIKDLWALHSLNVNVIEFGFKYNIEQIYAPIRENVWLPISHNFDINGKIFGVKMNYKYYATVSDYIIVVNEKLDKKKLIVIDEKTDKEYALALEEEKKLRGKKDILDTVSNNDTTQTFSVKELKKALKEIEKKQKESRQKKDEPEFIADYSISVDSLAYKQKKEYWDSIRPIPLTELEKKPGLMKKNDSIHAAKQSDTASKFAFLGKSVGGLLLGKNLKISQGVSLNYPSPLAHFNYNTIEGYNLNLPFEFNITNNKRYKILEITPVLRYGFSSREFYYLNQIRYYSDYNNYRQRSQITLEGGHYISQFNTNNPIYPFINTLYSLLWIDNYMKIYQKDFVSLNIRYPVLPYLQVKAGFEWNDRKELFNTSDESWVNKHSRVFTPNSPINTEINNTSFPEHKAFLINTEISYKPLIKYYRYNGKVSVIDENSPSLKLRYDGGINKLLGSKADFHRMEAGLYKHFDGVRRDFIFNGFIGRTLYDNSSFFMDYKHFGGNLTVFQLAETATSYNMLDYYRYSTSSGNYWGIQTQLNFRKFLLTQNLWLNLMGVRENIVCNYLKTETSPHYIELGYGLDNIFRILRVQAFCNFEDGKYQSFGIRIGLAGMFNMDDD